MANPVTSNIALIIPLTGADVDLWGEDDVNPNMAAIDGLIAGVQTLSLSNADVTLTVPAGFVATPAAGPTQSQNRVLKLTGTLAADVTITLPIPGSFLIDNQTVAGAFVVKARGITATQVVGLPPGEVIEVYNDGANVRFVGMARVGSLELWGGITAMPRWVTECTLPPYLYANGDIIGSTNIPTLNSIYTSKFGGNGVSTTGMPDLRGRVPLAYDGTGTRITSGNCGINGQTIGAAGGIDGVSLTATQNGSHFHQALINDPGHSHATNAAANNGTAIIGASNFAQPVYSLSATVFPATTGTRISSSNGFDNTYSSGTGAVHSNVQPAQVCGIWVVKT